MTYDQIRQIVQNAASKLLEQWTIYHPEELSPARIAHEAVEMALELDRQRIISCLRDCMNLDADNQKTFEDAVFARGGVGKRIRTCG